jgi:hypothetical protein
VTDISFPSALPSPASFTEAEEPDGAAPLPVDGGEESQSRMGRRREPVDGKPTPRDKWVRLTIELPPEAVDQLKERALRNRTTVRFLIMKALRSANIRIRDADMVEDGRKDRSRKAGGQ